MAEKWRMTLDELVYVTKASPVTLEEWAQLGAFGPRWREPRDRGKYRHVTREMAQRAVIMSRLVKAGMRASAAADISASHQVKEDSPLYAHAAGITLIIPRSDLP